MSTERAFSEVIDEILGRHPEGTVLQRELLTQCVRACIVCSTTCAACADACLAEENVQSLLNCIRTNLDCADVCQATGHILVRQTEPYWRLLYHQIEACKVACNACAEVCEEHASMHEHCRVCAETCRNCEQACADLLETFPV